MKIQGYVHTNKPMAGEHQQANNLNKLSKKKHKKSNKQVEKKKKQGNKQKSLRHFFLGFCRCCQSLETSSLAATPTEDSPTRLTAMLKRFLGSWSRSYTLQFPHVSFLSLFRVCVFFFVFFLSFFLLSLACSSLHVFVDWGLFPPWAGGWSRWLEVWMHCSVKFCVEVNKE